LKFDTVLCNPPYNDERQYPIYNHFTEKFAPICNQSVWVIPSSWVGNPSWAVGKQVRKDFDRAGVFVVYRNENDVFVTADVRTTSLVCLRGMKEGFEFKDRKTEKSVFKSRKDLLDNKILFCFEQQEIDFVERMKTYGNEKIRMFDQKPDTWKIGVFHLNRDKSKDALGKIRLIDPKEIEPQHTKKFLNLWEGKTEEEAREILPKIESFWTSKLIQYLLSRVWHTYTITSEVFTWIPVPDYSKVWTDEELFEKFEVTEEEKQWINSNP
jgi:hypothetical protein